MCDSFFPFTVKLHVCHNNKKYVYEGKKKKNSVKAACSYTMYVHNLTKSNENIYLNSFIFPLCYCAKLK